MTIPAAPSAPQSPAAAAQPDAAAAQPPAYTAPPPAYTAPPPAYAPLPPAPPSMSPADERMWSTLVHLGGLFFGFLAPLVGFLVLKDRGPFVRSHTATALNFQLTILLAYIVGGILSVVVIGLFIMLAAYILNIVFCIIAAVKANQGQWYRYPLTIPFFS